MTLAQTELNVLALLEREKSSTQALESLTGEVKENVVSMAATATGDFFFRSESLPRLEQLHLEIKTTGVQFFLPILIPARALAINVTVAPNSEATLFILARNTRRDISCSLNLEQNSRLVFYSLLEDAETVLTCEAFIMRGAQALFAGLTRAGNGIHTNIEIGILHKEPGGKTHQKFYSYAKDQAQIRFTGRITVEPGADGTEAHQIHRGMILTQDARIAAQPFLQILHDDVRCTHGSTVGYIDEDALQYLRARGIEKHLAEKILVKSSERQFIDMLPQGKAQNFFGFREAEP